MKDINWIEQEVIRLGGTIALPRAMLQVRVKPREDGACHVEIEDEVYHYISTERGQERSRKSTRSEDELLYWIFRDIVSLIAYDFELEYRSNHQDSRRIIFQHIIEKLEKLNNSGAKKERRNITEILKQAPFDDQSDERVILCKKLIADGHSNERAWEEACKIYPLPDLD